MNPLSFFTQDEAARYLRQNHNIEITAPELSVLCKFQRGPEHSTKGRMKMITQAALDCFANEQRTITALDGENPTA